MTRLTVRWAAGPDDQPVEGEALARIIKGEVTRDEYPGAGIEGSDLKVARIRLLLSIETADGRRLVTTFREGQTTPLLDDLRVAWETAWSEASSGGRPVYDPAPDVALYAAEVDRRIRANEPTELESVVGLQGWNPKTVRRHVQLVGFRDWPDFVASRRVKAGN